jgi:hypothetical protein
LNTHVQAGRWRRTIVAIAVDAVRTNMDIVLVNVSHVSATHLHGHAVADRCEKWSLFFFSE